MSRILFNPLMKIAAVITVMFFAAACSPVKESSESELKQVDSTEIKFLEGKLIINKLNCWIDLMPNSGNKIYLRGEVEILNLPDPGSFALSRIRITQHDEECYNFIPNDPTGSFDGRNSKIIYFSEPGEGLEQVDNIEIDKPIDIELVFVQTNKFYKYFINSITIEKTY
ncbi:MAG: hypothetical protein V1720_12480 [bacterium]